MKNWRYFYFFCGLVLSGFFLAGRWWNMDVPFIPESFWISAQEFFGKKNPEDGSDFVIFIMFVMSFSLVFLITLPGFLLWNKECPYRESTGWLARPMIRWVRITCITFLSLLIFSLLTSLLSNVLISYDMRIKLRDYLNVPLLMICAVGAIACGNCYRKASQKI